MKYFNNLIIGLQQLLIVASISLLISCNNNQHNGVYLQGFQFKGFKNEILRIKGNEMYVEKYNGSTFAGTIKYNCTQHADRIEFYDNGVIRLLLPTDTSLKLDDSSEYYMVDEVNSDAKFNVKPQTSQRLIEVNNGKIKILSDKSVQEQNKKVEVLNETYTKKENPEPENSSSVINATTLEVKNEFLFQQMFSEEDYNYDSKKQLVRSIIKEGISLDLHTEVLKKFYYSLNGISKLVAITATYEYEGERISDCHACFPTLSIVRFRNEDDAWIKEQLIEEFEGSSGAWGMASEIKFIKRENAYSIKIITSYTQNGETENSQEIYDLENFKKVHSSQTKE